MYYRKGFYPRPGQADVPDDLWAEFQRIRGHMSTIDQNNVDRETLTPIKIVPPTDLEHNGTSDIVDQHGEFLYKTSDASSLAERNIARQVIRWRDLGKYGLTLSAQSRGDGPWVVGASIDFGVYNTEDGTHVDDSLGPYIEGGLGGHDRANIYLRIKSSQDGLSVAEGVGGINHSVFGGSVAVVTTVIARGGQIQFSPSIKYREMHRGDSGTHTTAHEVNPDGGGGTLLTQSDEANGWGVRILKANIFAFALYR